MHDPVSLDAPGGLAAVEDEGFLDAYLAAARIRGEDGLVRARGFPVPRRGRPVRPRAVRVLALPRAKKVPLLLLLPPEARLF